MDISWKLIDVFFEENKNNLVAHHLESYNNFFDKGIFSIFRENNPIRFIENTDESNENKNQCYLYLGGKEGNKIYFGKPIIYDDNHTHYMYPNDARLRNMSYGTTIHYDVDVDFIYYENDVKKETSITLEKIYLGRFPIMLQSNLCILKSLTPEVRYNMGECRNDYGGYFIIDGKEKVILCQEKFANNMLYVKKNKDDDIYSYSAEIRSVSEDASKPTRTTSVKMVAKSSKYTNQQLVVDIPNVKKPIPLFIVMRALGVVSDKQIIETCLLDMDKYSSYIDSFIPSIHDANIIFNQETALEYISTFIKRETIDSTLEILTDYFLPHIGEKNFLDKAYFLGIMVNKLLKVYMNEEKPTDRDSFLFKRVEVTGSLLYDLFREYFLIQNREIAQKIDKENYFNPQYKNNFVSLIEDNYVKFFKERTVEIGLKKAFKGNWGASSNTKKLGVVQDLNRLSWYSFISHLRKIILPLDASAKVVGPRHLNSSQWGFIDPVDTPDGAHIGLHKHLSISTIITSGSSGQPIIEWLRYNTSLKLLQECNTEYLGKTTKMFVNGKWIGVIENPFVVHKTLKLLRRNGVIPLYTSISFDYSRNEMNIYTDSGRLMRPIYFLDDNKKNPSFNRTNIIELFKKNEITWTQITSGFKEKKDKNFSYKENKVYQIYELYPELEPLSLILREKEGVSLNEGIKEMEKILLPNQSIIDYIDTNEEETSLIAMQLEDINKNKLYTNLEIHPSLIFGVMGNSVIFPEHNQFPRDVFSCGQSRQAVSVYHSNYQMRIDKMGVVLNYGEVPLIKSRYLKYINKEEQPYGINAIVAIMSYTGYNVEDAILINAGSVARGIFNTSYYTMYESREESAKISGNNSNSVFTNIAESSKKIVGTKPGYDYSYLDNYGMIKENTPLHDKIVLIGKITTSIYESDVGVDASVVPKKGQLGFVDKSFITEGEEGTKIAKIRIREERIPAIGDKMASRAGQKGTLGLIIPEEDMPFTSDGVRPDLIINPHALPSRMTIGQLVESILGKVCVSYGGYGDCTAFLNKGSNVKTYGEVLTNAGYHSSGNQLLYNGMTGEEIQADIYIGPTYYMRLKHMVKDKINYRARGPRTVLTRQTVQGRANDGGLRIGEMERDGILAHGASYFLNESFLIRGDEYYMAVCNQTGMISIYNEPKNLLLSPFADGPIKFITTLDGKLNLENVSKYGRSFSILRIPYSLKLLIQELLVMNIGLRIITDENIEQLLSLSYSDNIILLTKRETEWKFAPSNRDNLELIEQNGKSNEMLKSIIQKINREVYKLKENEKNNKKTRIVEEEPIEAETLEPIELNALEEIPMYKPPSPTNPFGLPLLSTFSNFLGFGQQPAPENPVYPPTNSPQYAPTNSPMYAPNSPMYTPTNSPLYNQEYTQEGIPPTGGLQPSEEFDVGDESLNTFFNTLPMQSKQQILNLKTKRDQKLLLNMVKKKYEEKNKIQPPVNDTNESVEDILSVKEETKDDKDGKEGKEEDTKRITIN